MMVDAPRSVLHVTTVHQPYDTRIFQKEVRSLAASGYDVRLATTVDDSKEKHGVAFIPLGSRPSRFRRITRGLRAFMAILRHRDAIVHVHDPELLVIAALPAFAGARVVYDVHEFYAESFRAPSSRPPLLQRFLGKAYDLVESIVLPRFAGVVIVSEEMLPRYRRFVPETRIALVRNFPNLDRAALESARAQPHPLGGRPYVIHTGGITKVRAFDDLIDAALRLQSRGTNLTIVNLGGSADYEADELNEAMSRAQRAGVIVKGAVSYDEALVWLAHAHLGYLPLKDTENNRLGMPNKLFEYALFGLPVVAADLGRVADIVNETKAGVLVPVGDGAAHGDALAELASNDALRSRLSRAATAASSTYSFAGEFERLELLYRTIGSARAKA